MLIGTAAAIVVVAAIPRFARQFGADGPHPRTVLAAGMLALAIGVRLPQRFVVWCCAAAWHRLARRRAEVPVAQVVWALDCVDRPLQWVVLSAVALAAGIATVLIPLWLRLAEALLAWLDANFVWSAPALPPLHALMVFSVLVLPLACLGLALSFSQRLGGRDEHGDARTTAWLLLGAALGVTAAAALASPARSGALAWGAAALAALAASLVAGLSAPPSRGYEAAGDAAEQRSALPQWSDQSPTLLRTAIVAVGTAAACAMAIWMSAVASTGDPRRHAVFLLLSLTAGILVGCATRTGAAPSVGSFGGASAVAGLTLGLAVLCLRGDRSPDGGAAAMLACAAAAAMGFAKARGRQALVQRTAGRSGADAVVLARMLVGGAVAVGFVAPLAVAQLGAASALGAITVLLLLLGAALAWRESEDAPAVRRLRAGWALTTAAAALAWTLAAVR
ncbi:MAG: hypothetical protein HY763_15985 [Planctomycetes bacterium]|nr:hypothetical protein [Planctomycetota bacterium]